VEGGLAMLGGRVAEILLVGIPPTLLMYFAFEACICDCDDGVDCCFTLIRYYFYGAFLRVKKYRK
jgi:hypothetical protein